MTHFYIGSDRITGTESRDMNIIAKELRKCGHSVTVGSVSPEQEAASYHVSKKSVFLFLVGGVAPATMWSFKEAIAAGSSPPTIFLHAGWTSTRAGSPMHSEQKMLNHHFEPEYDSGGFANAGAMKRSAGSANTVGEYMQKYSKYIGTAWASSAKQMGQKICNGQVTGYGSKFKSGTSGTSGTKGSKSANGQSANGSSNVAPLLNGEETFEELVGDICKSIDLIFAVKRSTVVVTDYESIYAQAKYLRESKQKPAASEDIKLWQIEDGSFEMDVNQYGYYNTVRVHYKNGVVVEDYEDLVIVFGVVAIDYYEPKIDKATAEMKAKAYLAAHVRDFDMAIRATILHDGDIEIGDIVTIENPMTMRDETRRLAKRSPEYYFVKGNSVSWEANSLIKSDLDLRYGAESPEGKEIPEAGTRYKNDKNGKGSGTASKDLQAAIEEVGKKASKFSYSGACQSHSCIKQQHTGDCFGMSDYIACELQALGVTTRIRGYPTYVKEHRTVQYKDNNGQWKNFPYRKFSGFDSRFYDTSGVNNSWAVKKTC